jgi:hypothetical protein
MKMPGRSRTLGRYLFGDVMPGRVAKAWPRVQYLEMDHRDGVVGSCALPFAASLLSSFAFACKESPALPGGTRRRALEARDEVWPRLKVRCPGRPVESAERHETKAIPPLLAIWSRVPGNVPVHPLFPCLDLKRTTGVLAFMRIRPGLSRSALFTPRRLPPSPAAASPSPSPPSASFRPRSSLRASSRLRALARPRAEPKSSTSRCRSWAHDRW